MDRLRDHFLAGSALALQKHGRAAIGHLRHQIENLQHGLALAHDVFEVVALLQRALELNVFFFGAAPADSGAHVGEKLLVVPRLLNEICRPNLHRAHGIFHCAERSDHDDRQARIMRSNLREDLHAIAARKSEIEQHQIKRTFRDLRKTVFPGDRSFNFKAFHLQQGLKRFTNRGLIVDDEHRACRCWIDVHRAARNDCCFRHGLPSCSAENPGQTSYPTLHHFPLESFRHALE